MFTIFCVSGKGCLGGIGHGRLQSSNKIRLYFGIVRGKERLEGIFPLPVQTSLHRKPVSELFRVAPLTGSESNISFYSVALLANVEATKSSM